MSSTTQLRDDLAAAKAELDELNEIEQADPSQFDDELRALQSDARTKVEQLERQLLDAQSTRSDPPPPPEHEAVPPSPAENAPTQEAPKKFRINDTVTARYAKDRQFYPATVVAVMGSASDPVYTIKFKGYPGTEKVRAHELRAISYQSSTNSKRKADDSPLAASGSSAATKYSSSVMSAAPSVDPALLAASKQQNAKLPDPTAAPPEKRLKKTAKKLEQGKQNWQNFKQSSVKGKAAKLMNKQSMFRTGDSATARVGFTGSGTAMREDAARSRHTYGSLESNDD